MPIDEGEKKSQDLNVMFIETSAKAGYNVKQVRNIFNVSCFLSHKYMIYFLAAVFIIFGY